MARVIQSATYDDPSPPLPLRPGPIAVAGATGRQGGAAVRHLLRAGWPVRALTRHPRSERARALAAMGAEIYRADFAEPNSLDQALAGAYGAFSVQPTAIAGTRREADYGMAFADAAWRGEVRHLVYASIAGVERATKLPQFRPKVEIEEHIHRLGLTATVLRSAFLMDNLLVEGWRGARLWGAIAGALGGALPVQMVASDDVGVFAALAFGDPERFVGYAVELAGDEVTVARARQAFRSATGHSARFVPLPYTILRWFDADLARLCDWIRTDGFQADIDSLRQLHPRLKNLETGLKEAHTRASG